MKATYYNQTAADVSEKALTLARAFSIAYECSYILSDMELDLDTFNGLVDGIGYLPKAYYFAIREKGAESGELEYVKARCAALGAPVCVLKIENGVKDGFYTLKIKTK